MKKGTKWHNLISQYSGSLMQKRLCIHMCICLSCEGEGEADVQKIQKESLLLFYILHLL